MKSLYKIKAKVKPAQVEVWVEADSLYDAIKDAKEAIRKSIPIEITETRTAYFFEEILIKAKNDQVQPEV